jgi:hypothetical protein
LNNEHDITGGVIQVTAPYSGGLAALCPALNWLAVVIVASALLLGNTVTAADVKGKKVLYVNSYHNGYPWSDGIFQSIKANLEKAGVEVKMFNLDTYN